MGPALVMITLLLTLTPLEFTIASCLTAYAEQPTIELDLEIKAGSYNAKVELDLEISTT